VIDGEKAQRLCLNAPTRPGPAEPHASRRRSKTFFDRTYAMKFPLAACFTSIALVLGACASNPAPDAKPRAEGVKEMMSADVAAMQELTRILIDASALYADAAKDSKNETYSNTLNALAGDRKTMADAFQARIASLGSAPAEAGQALGTGHRMFMEARTLGDQDTKVAIQEALRGERYLEEKIEKAANDTTLSPATRAFLSAQLPSVSSGKAKLEVYAKSLG
jgi:uncharacterized protein (TIGR02284 family)